jgi:hypothetical protein
LDGDDTDTLELSADRDDETGNKDDTLTGMADDENGRGPTQQS